MTPTDDEDRRRALVDEETQRQGEVDDSDATPQGKVRRRDEIRHDLDEQLDAGDRPPHHRE